MKRNYELELNALRLGVKVRMMTNTLFQVWKDDCLLMDNCDHLNKKMIQRSLDIVERYEIVKIARIADTVEITFSDGKEVSNNRWLLKGSLNVAYPIVAQNGIRKTKALTVLKGVVDISTARTVFNTWSDEQLDELVQAAGNPDHLRKMLLLDSDNKMTISLVS